MAVVVVMDGGSVSLVGLHGGAKVSSGRMGFNVGISHHGRRKERG